MAMYVRPFRHGRVRSRRYLSQGSMALPAVTTGEVTPAELLPA
jgi:hypothetical protein